MLTARLDAIQIPTRGLQIAQLLERARVMEEQGMTGPPILFVQALWRHDLAQCQDSETERFIRLYCRDIDADDAEQLARVFLQRSVAEYCDFFDA